jgi:outer membrane protein OmpA-like peptidoglycan-associated protein
MISVGYGLSRPLNNNLSEEDKALNRRVEVKIIK